MQIKCWMGTGNSPGVKPSPHHGIKLTHYQNISVSNATKKLWTYSIFGQLQQPLLILTCREEASAFKVKNRNIPASSAFPCPRQNHAFFSSIKEMIPKPMPSFLQDDAHLLVKIKSMLYDPGRGLLLSPA